ASDREAGAAALAGILASHPESLYADDAALKLAELELADGRVDAATAHLQWALERHPRGDKSDAIRLELAGIQLERSDAAAAAETARGLRVSLLDPDRRRAAHRLRAELARAEGDPAEELRWLGRVRADQDDPGEAAAVEERIDEILASLDDAAMDRVARALGRRQPVGRLWLNRAERGLATGNRSAALAALARARAHPLTRAEAERLVHLEDRLAGRGPSSESFPSWAEAEPSLLEVPGATTTLGVALPLSGPYAEFGRESLQGVLLATGAFDAGRAVPSRVRVVVRDTAGLPERGAAAIASLADDPEVTAVVGPLLAPVAEAAGVVAEERGLPLVTLTRRESVAELGRFVLRVGATPRHEAERLADYAIGTLGLARFAILYPDDAYGRALRATFWDAVEARGGQVVGVGRYATDATDFAAPIRRLIGFDFLNRGQQEALTERARRRKRAKRLPVEAATELREEALALVGPEGEPLPPFVDFDALFVPDAHETVGLIAPHLAFHEVRGVRLLGTAGWNHPDLVRLGGSHVDGAIFATPFFAGSEEPFVAEFSRRFEATFERGPDYLAAQAFDAAHLVLLQVARGAAAREAVLTGLLRARNVSGASGALSIGEDGAVRRRPHLLGVERGRILSVDETGAAPYLRIPEPPTDNDDEPAT
ncbi:MAG: penicillin-binding protein activator, partial [Planctomycetota bacterium]|nr:penicillin-binding protein activator [Planctomycetota bacterium]